MFGPFRSEAGRTSGIASNEASVPAGDSLCLAPTRCTLPRKRHIRLNRLDFNSTGEMEATVIIAWDTD